VRPKARPTPDDLRRRAYQRRYAARRRAAALARKNANATTCQRTQGQGRCGAVLVDATDRALGIVQRACPACARREAGVCRDCPRPVEGQRGKALRCGPCKRRAVQRAVVRYTARHREELAARACAYARRLTGDERARRLALKVAWRKANPDKVRAYKAREKVRRAAEISAYQKAYRERNRERIRERERRRGRAQPIKSALACRSCGAAIPRPAVGRARVTCNACAPPWTVARRKPVAPLAGEVPGAPLDHTCLGGCGARMRGRRKKCDTCAARERRKANALLHREGWRVAA
jgi:hypothetical protein